MSKRWLFALLLIGLATPALSHQQGSSYSQWEFGERPEVTVRVSELDLTRAQLHPQYTEAYRQTVVDYLQGHLRLARGESYCGVSEGVARQSQPGWLAVSWGFDCSATAGIWLLESHILLSQASGHLHFARLMLDEPVDRLLTIRDKQWPVDLSNDAASHATGFVDYLKLGVIHILEGWDHLAFVLGLLLLAQRQRGLWLLITGFTLGHSMTLAAASLGWLQPNIVLIEAVIAWTIALLATEVLWQKQPANYWLALPLGLLGLLLLSDVSLSLLLGLVLLTLGYFCALASAPRQQAYTRAFVTVAFGLVHGCGFASVLSELTLPSNSLLMSLLGFNAGVEVGQIAVVLLVWPTLKFLARCWAGIRETLALGLLTLASYWWLLRLM